MLVFIDESGDAGFKINEGSSHHFVVSIVIFQSKEDVREINGLIDKIRRDMDLKEDYEFRFAESSKKVKQFSLQGDLLHIYTSAAETAKILGKTRRPYLTLCQEEAKQHIDSFGNMNNAFQVNLNK